MIGVYDGSQYIMFSTTDVSPYTFERRTASAIDGTWSAATTITSPVSLVSSSHVDVIRDGSILWSVLLAPNGNLGLYLMRSYDWGLTWQAPVKSFLLNKAGGWDKYVYRASAIRTTSGFDLWYSAEDGGGTPIWHIGRTKIYL
jgi:hypothetical protein